MSALVGDNGIAAAIDAGRAQVTASDRTLSVKATVRGITVEAPVAFSASGQPAVLDAVVAIATAEANRVAPLRAGIYRFSDLPSIVAWARRYLTPETCAYLTPPAVGEGYLAVVVDDLPPSATGTNRTVRAHLPIILHERFAAWRLEQGKWLAAETFCSLVEQAGDELSSTDLISLTQNLEVKSESNWTRKVDDKGGIRIVTEDQSGPATRIPRTFAFAVPVFEFDAAAQQLQAQLFSKIEKGRPLFMFKIIDVKRVIASAMVSVQAAISQVVPPAQVYFGTAP